MATYYIDLAGDFNNATCLTAAKGAGPGSLHNLVSGWGGASTKLASGDVCLLKGTARMDRLVKLTCGASIDGWAEGDVVRNYNSGGGTPGDDWTGRVVKKSYAADTSLLIVQVDSSYSIADIATADGIQNTTKEPDENVALSAKACQPIPIDEDWATTPSGGLPIMLCGSDASYAEDAARAVFDGNSAAADCFVVDDIDHWAFKSIEITGFTGWAINSEGTESCGIWYFLNCIVHDCANNITGYINSRCVFGCKFYNITNVGFIGDTDICYGNLSYGNGTGFYDCEKPMHCLAYNNTGKGFEDCEKLVHCVAHNNGDDGWTSSSSAGLAGIACRITSHAVGIDSDASYPNFAMYTYLNNTDDCDVMTNYFRPKFRGATVNHWVQEDSLAADTDDGYIDSANDNYNLDPDTATYYNEAITLD